MASDPLSFHPLFSTFQPSLARRTHTNTHTRSVSLSLSHPLTVSEGHTSDIVTHTVGSSLLQHTTEARFKLGLNRVRVTVEVMVRVMEGRWGGHYTDEIGSGCSGCSGWGQGDHITRIETKTIKQR